MCGEVTVEGSGGTDPNYWARQDRHFYFGSFCNTVDFSKQCRFKTMTRV